MNPLAEKYLRKSALPTIWCPGCGSGTVLSSTLTAIDELGIIDDIALVGGIGCAGWIPVYIDADTMHTLHGRTLPFATGLKMSDPKRKVIAFCGDGDGLGIGGNHFIHTARRNIDITMVLVNNQIYGMTGGQASPCTPNVAKSKTSVYGNPETPLDSTKLAKAAGATYIARWMTNQPMQLARAIKEAISHKGFSFVEAFSQCPTQAGRVTHGMSDPTALLKVLKSNTMTVKKAEKATEEEREGKLLIGKIYHKEDGLEFSDSYSKLVDRATGA
jgi:2-oxoglutarate ferredoxin oxidoreductase subunit beta